MERSRASKALERAVKVEMQGCYPPRKAWRVYVEGDLAALGTEEDEPMDWDSWKCGTDYLTL